jgi:hypothetical protein
MLLLLHWPLPAAARSETRHVLVLSSSERPFAPQSEFADALVRDLIRESREPIQFADVSIQAARASDSAPDASIARRIHAAFGSGRLDLVITIGGPAATFAQQFRQELFPATPTLIAGVDRRFVENGTFTSNETTVALQHDPAMMIDEILRLRPETQSVTVIVGASHLERFWLQEMKRDFRRFDGRLQFHFTNELSYKEIVERCRTMPDKAAIFYAILSVDAKGEPRAAGDTFASLHEVANAPMFALHGMGSGTVGGPLLSTDDLSRTTTQVALRVLAGESPASIKTPTLRSGTPTYDARELQRWNIDEGLLPQGSVVLFREPPIWRRPIAFGVLLGGIPVIALVVLAGLIKRRRADSRAAVAMDRPAPAAADGTVTMTTAGDDGELVAGRSRAELSNLSRHLLQTHDRERATLAKTLHDDVGPRMVELTLRLHNLQAAAPDGELADIREKLSGLVGEIAAVPDPVHQRLELIGLAIAGRGFCQELSARHGVEIHFQDEDVPRHLPSEIALALFRVLEEAADNAIAHSAAREIWVSMRGTAAEIRLVVVDQGVGFDTQRTVPRGVGGDA